MTDEVRTIVGQGVHEMNKKRLYSALAKMSALTTTGTVFLLGGCDPTVQSAVESGIINVSTTALTSVLTAIGTLFIQTS